MQSPDSNEPQFIFKLLKNNVVTGLLIIIPILVTLWVGWWSISVLTDWAINLLQESYPEITNQTWLNILFRLVTILVLLAAAFLIGLLTKVTLGKQLIRLTQKILLHLPILSIVYSTCQQIGDTVQNQHGGIFKQVVLFEYPRKGSWALGFITNQNEGEFELNKYFDNGVYSIFMPTTPNPTSGYLFYIPKEDCILLDMPAGEAMKLIVSGGVVRPAQFETKKEM